jgi:hypothetical protein
MFPGSRMGVDFLGRLAGDAGADESTGHYHEHSEQAPTAAEPDCGATVSDVLNAQPVPPLGEENLRAGLAAIGAHFSRLALLTDAIAAVYQLGEYVAATSDHRVSPIPTHLLRIS